MRYRKRLEIWETNYGRDAGWIVERQGHPLAVLSDQRPEEMFWDSYKLEIVTEDPELRRRMATANFWANAESEGLIFRNEIFGDVAEHAFPAVSPFPEPGRLLMRGLYLPIGEPSPLDRIALWFRKVSGDTKTVLPHSR